ncbi:MAG: hypothetical protein MMC33_008751 [Icmadophila ericetorum]|nr:hypothetical protein [Icmadophila ericetorum]
MATWKPSTVHLVGSVPLGSAEEVFTTALKDLPKRLRRIPDGETGERNGFVAWQMGVFPPKVSAIGAAPPTISRTGEDTKSVGWDGWVIGASEKNEEVKCTIEDIKPTGYDDNAIASYDTFVKLRESGVIPKGVRFQVSLPTPCNTIWACVDERFRAQVEPLYEKRLLDSLRRIQDTIPARDVAIQLDLAMDVAFIEHERGYLKIPIFQSYFEPAMKCVIERVVRISNAVDKNVELGYHLCYGDLGHKHFMEPQDLGLLVEIAGEIFKRVDHPVAWVHMPVPKDRTDKAYFEPLKNLKLPDGQLFLGLVHANDEEGTKKRIETAIDVYQKPFGIATECGMGRCAPEEFSSLMAITASVTL